MRIYSHIKNRISKRTIVRILSVILFLVSMYFVVSPIYPAVEFYVEQNLLKSIGKNPYEKSQNPTSGDASVDEEYPSVNTLVIPSIGVDIPIVEGYSDDALSMGAWRIPQSSTPDKGGNTVITGHRFQYLPPNSKTFYNLDKVEVGEEVIVYWSSKKYVYIISEIFEVTPERLDVEAQTEDARVTLYTCTPLWTASRRLVVIAKLQ